MKKNAIVVENDAPKSLEHISMTLDKGGRAVASVAGYVKSV